MRISHFIASACTLLLLAAPGAHAAEGGGSKPPPPSKAPLGAPPSPNSEELNSSYEFRNRMSSDPICQDLARQSDETYLDAEAEADKKRESLEQLRKRAQAAGCL